MKIVASSVVAKVYICTRTEDSFNTEQEEKEDEHWFHSSNVLSILASLAFQVIREKRRDWKDKQPAALSAIFSISATE